MFLLICTGKLVLSIMVEIQEKLEIFYKFQIKSLYFIHQSQKIKLVILKQKL